MASFCLVCGVGLLRVACRAVAFCVGSPVVSVVVRGVVFFDVSFSWDSGD